MGPNTAPPLRWRGIIRHRRSPGNAETQGIQGARLPEENAPRFRGPRVPASLLRTSNTSSEITYIDMRMICISIYTMSLGKRPVPIGTDTSDRQSDTAPEITVADVSAFHRDTITVFLWLSRNYVAGAMSGAPRLDVGPNSLWTLSERALLSALASVWDSVMAATPMRLMVHSPACECVSPHEQALLIALRHLADDELDLYHSTLRAILPPAAARELHGRMTDLACITIAFDEEVDRFQAPPDNVHQIH